MSKKIISVILAHPDKNSFNHAIADAVVKQLKQNGYHVHFHDLYKERFDPLLFEYEFSEDAPLPPTIKKHCRQIAAADGIVIVHPNWWGMPPAILKGWVDRVIRPGVAYNFIEGDKGEGVPVGLLKAKTMVVFNTSNTTAPREAKVFGDPLQKIWKDCIYGLCGPKRRRFVRKIFRVIVTSTLKQRKQWLNETQSIIRSLFPKDKNSACIKDAG
jgi:NAD(P)H dehydrogenase (quinone)